MADLADEEKLIELRRFVAKGINEGRLLGSPEGLINDRVFSVAISALDTFSSWKTGEALDLLLSCFSLTEKGKTQKDSPE